MCLVFCCFTTGSSLFILFFNLLSNIFIIHWNKLLSIYICNDCFLAMSIFHKDLVKMSKTIHVFVNKKLFICILRCAIKTNFFRDNTVELYMFKKTNCSKPFCLLSTHLSDVVFIFILLSIHISIYLKKKLF